MKGETKNMNMTIKVAFVAAVVAAMAGCSDNRDTLEIFTWSDYFSPEVIQEFERENGCRVNTTTFDSNEAMYAKLKAGSTEGYDILTPSSYIIPLLVSEGIVTNINHGLLPNVSNNFDHSYDSMITDSNMTYSVPYIVCYSGIMYNRYTDNGDGTVRTNDMEDCSWNVFGNDLYRGRTSLLDDMREVIGIGLMYNGFSVNSENPDEIEKSVETILDFRRNVRKFDAESYKSEVTSGSMTFGHAYSSDSFQIIVGDEENGHRDDIGFAFPKEGFTVACDEFVIMSTSKKNGLAHRFIDFMYRNDNSRKSMEYNVSVLPNRFAIGELDTETRKLIVIDEKTASRGQVIRQFVKPETYELYNAAWDRIRSIKK